MGGIGWYKNQYLTPFQLYDKVLLDYRNVVVVVVIDQVSLIVRRGFIDDTANFQKPRWRDVLISKDPALKSVKKAK